MPNTSNRRRIPVASDLIWNLTLGNLRIGAAVFVGDRLHSGPVVTAIGASPVESHCGGISACDKCHPAVRVTVRALQGDLPGNV
jgi:hypothetical protein